MFTYCLNNPVNMIDEDGFAPKYINAQNENEYVDINGVQTLMKDVQWGTFGNIAFNGCGVVASYNVLVSYNEKETFENVRNNLWVKNGPLAEGLLGAKTSSIDNYMKTEFNTVNTSVMSSTWAKKSKNYQSVVVMLKMSGFKGLHYIAGIGTGTSGSFRFYNTGLKDSSNKSINGKILSMNMFLYYVKLNKATALKITGMSGKK